MDKIVLGKITEKARAGYSKFEVPLNLLQHCSPEGLRAIKEIKMAWEIKIIIK